MFGLSFLNSLFLWGLAAAAVPIIIHLIKRNRAVKLPFAAMRFLQMDPVNKMRSQRLKQILLLLMRVAALAFLAMAFARPFVNKPNTQTLWGYQPKSVVLLIDQSFSMGYGDRFPQTLGRAREIIDALRPGDEVAVVGFSESARLIESSAEDLTVVRSALDGLHLTNRATNYPRALQTALGVLQESPLATKEIYVISDFQKSGWPNSFATFDLPPGIRVVPVDVGGSTAANVAITDVRISEEQTRGATRDVLVRLNNFGGEARRVTVELTLKGRKAASRSAMVPAKDQIVVRLRARIPRGTSQGVVTISDSDDGLQPDNTFFFVAEDRTSLEVLAVNGEPEPRDISRDELFFVERAVNLPDAHKYKLVAVQPGELSAANLADYRTVILANVKRLDRRTVERLKFYVRNGGGLIFALGDQINATIFNQLFGDLSPVRVGERAYGRVKRDVETLIAAMDYQHPIFRPFAEPGQGDLSAAQIYEYFLVEAAPSAHVLARFDDGSPAFVEHKVGAGKVLLFASTLDTEWGNLPIKPVFLPWLYQTLDYVAAERKGQNAFLVGQPVPAFGASAEEDLRVRTPAGDIHELEGGFFEATDESGIYEVLAGEQMVGQFAVNVDPRESNLTPLSRQDFEAKINTSGELAQQTTYTRDVDYDAQLEGRQKLWRLLIFGVILLLIAETWLANRTYR